ncbi:hypothetical protein V6Z12_D10G283400 [Gossypium hirsutum]
MDILSTPKQNHFATVLKSLVSVQFSSKLINIYGEFRSWTMYAISTKQHRHYGGMKMRKNNNKQLSQTIEQISNFMFINYAFNIYNVELQGFSMAKHLLKDK